MATEKGSDLIVTIDGSPIAAAKSCDIDVECDLIETASPSTGKFRTYIPARKGWKIDTNHFVLKYPDTVLPEFMDGLVGKYVQIEVKRKSTIYLADKVSGTAICVKSHITATKGKLAYGSFSFVGTGALNYINPQITQ